MADIVSALVPLTGLAELSLCSAQAAVGPAALGQLESLRSLTLADFDPLILEAGCGDLPNLLSLYFVASCFGEDAQMLPGVTALQRLTCIEFWGHQEMPVLTLSLCSSRGCSAWFSRQSPCVTLYIRVPRRGCSGCQLTWGH